ncbi:MAG: type II secretion system F family protein, partial [Desulfobacteraceae bacterium]|nr:type II secretion system F family protein [Desulfobacteraceae bacterium]
MPTYTYQAINENGGIVKGTIEADTQEAVAAILSGNNLIPSRIRLQTAVKSSALMTSIGQRLRPVRMIDLITFTKQFKTMLKAGIPMLVLLQSLEAQTEDPRLKKIVLTMSHDISQGSTLHDAFSRHPDVFSTLYCSMIRAGETSGALPEVLDRLIYILEHEHKIRTDVRSALQYPMIVGILLAVSFFVLLTYVIPKFSTIFQRSGLKLPLLTQICIQFYNFMVHYWLIFIAIVLIAGIAVSYLLRTEAGRMAADRAKLMLPLLGKLFQKAAMARFASIFSILQSSGVAVLESMRILSGTINNRAIAAEFDQLMGQLEEGRGIAEPLRQSKFFSPIVVNMIAIGEESGHLEEMLNDIAAHYDWELSYAVKRFSDSLGPILIVGMAAIIGFFALAIYMP